MSITASSQSLEGLLFGRKANRQEPVTAFIPDSPRGTATHEILITPWSPKELFIAQSPPEVRTRSLGG